MYIKCIYLILLILLLFLYIKKTEGFIDAPVPDVCKKAGYRVPDDLAKLLEGKPLNFRAYTESECLQLDDAVYQDGRCYQLKDNTKKDKRYNVSKENIIVNYSELCVGLNKIETPIVKECLVNGKNLGKPNKAFIVTMKDNKGNDKKWEYGDNFFQMYSKNECKQLKGEWTSLEKIMEEIKISSDEIKTFVASNGEDMGICLHASSYMPSAMCVDSAPATTASKVSGVLKDGIKDWLN